jgi:hypothetical protein
VIGEKVGATFDSKMLGCAEGKGFGFERLRFVFHYAARIDGHGDDGFVIGFFEVGHAERRVEAAAEG